MAVKKPLVLGADGRPQQLQAGDSISVASAPPKTSLTADVDMPKGSPVYPTTANHMDLGQADAAGTALVVGLTMADVLTAAAVDVQHSGPIFFSNAEWDAITGDTGGLTAGATYYLSAATPGTLSTVPPSTAGELVVEVGVALSVNIMLLNPKSPILL